MMQKCVSHVCDGLSPVVALATVSRGTGNSKGDATYEAPGYEKLLARIVEGLPKHIHHIFTLYEAVV